jgi:hypothetical protein
VVGFVCERLRQIVSEAGKLLQCGTTDFDGFHETKKGRLVSKEFCELNAKLA